MAEPAVITALPTGRDDRLRLLLEAQRAITSDLSLDDVLDRIVRAACAVSGARYGALGVIGPDGNLEQFIHHGIDPALARRIRRPRGHGVLAELIQNPTPIRVDDIADAPGSAGFPPNHPPMKAFLGVPIRVRGEVFGDLYLADPAARSFDEIDEEMVLTLAAAAGTAIDNARLYHAARRSQEWLHASGEVARALLADADVDLLHEVVARAVSAGEADYGQIVLPTADGRLLLAATFGLGADALRGEVYSAEVSPIGQAVASAQPLTIASLDDWVSPDFDNRFGYGPVMVAPLVDAQGCRGALMLVRTVGRPAFTSTDLEQATTYANQVALAMQFADAREDAEWLQVLEVRHKLAEDLHDNVMQRLFATGVGLQALAGQPLEAKVQSRLQRYVTDLDETIDEIRDRVFGLRSGGRNRPTTTRYPRIAAPGAEVEIGPGGRPTRRGRRRSDWTEKPTER
jgi:GAF domain-containing protein